jgi:beta-xylosidase
MKSLLIFTLMIFAMSDIVSGQSPSFNTYINPVIPGDHPDPTLTKIGNHFYTSGSSFNPTPKIYHSTDLVHWEVIAQPVKASWTTYGNSPGGGIWGGHLVYYNNYYWHYFGRGGGAMYFVKADQPEGPWSHPPTQVVSSPVPLGVDNSIFIDEDTNKWYMLTKAGHENNHLVELGPGGQPTGTVLDLTWLNPNSEGNPYGWAEGPVMWKYNGYYFYSFAQHLVGSQYVMRSDTLTDDESAWTIIGTNIFTGSTGVFNAPNHISPAVLLDDSTSWVVAHSYYNGWYAHGRQGLLCQVIYNEEGFPQIQRPATNATVAPDLPSSGIPWMVPRSDMFDEATLNPEWSFLGYTADNTYSLSDRPGWLRLTSKGNLNTNTLIKNDGEHNYTLITKVEYDPVNASDEAGLWIINGPETLQAKVFSSVNDSGVSVLKFSFNTTEYEVENTVGSIVWLKLIRAEHTVSGFYSPDGITWHQIGTTINASAIDIEQTQFNNFTGNQQGLYVTNNLAYFDLYIYRDAYSNIAAQSPANHSGTLPTSTILRNINNDDWALYAGVEFGNNDYQKTPVSIEISASSAEADGIVEIWLDSVDTGNKIGECQIGSTGSWTNYQIFSADVDSVSGRHDVYLKFTGTGTSELFRIDWFRFISQYGPPVSIENNYGANGVIQKFQLNQNYPNPFNSTTNFSFIIPDKNVVSLTVYDILGKEIVTLASGELDAGEHFYQWDAKDVSSGLYFFRLDAGDFSQTKKLVLLR